jgi:dynein heavy chain
MTLDVYLCAGFFAAMGKASGGRNEVDPRFVSMLSVFNLTLPSDDTVKHICTSILAGHTVTFVEEIQTVVPVIAEMMHSLYKVRNTVKTVGSD